MNNSRALIAGLSATMILLALCVAPARGQDALSQDRLQKLLKQFPAADANGDGVLTSKEASEYRRKVVGGRGLGGRANDRRSNRGGVKRSFKVDPRWDRGEFPEHAVSRKSPAEIADIYKEVNGKQPAVVSYPKPKDGGLRIIGIGHSFMAPGYKTLPKISQAAGMKQPLYTHLGGGMTGSARYKWEQENGIFQFDNKPTPKLLASLANAEWDVMLFGPYYNDRPIYYSCWIDFCLKYNPNMKFYISDAWPQLEQLKETPKSEAFFTEAILDRMGAEKRAGFSETIEPLRKAYPGRVFVLPTSDAMVLAAKRFIKGDLPDVEGLHRVIGKKERSLWKDRLGHLGPGFERLEGYVFYATLYQKSPEEIDGPVNFGPADYPSPELDRVFREIAWKAVSEHPYSGVAKVE